MFKIRFIASFDFGSDVLYAKMEKTLTTLAKR